MARNNAIEWTRPKGLYSDSRTVKWELCELLRLLKLLNISAVDRTEYAYVIEFVTPQV